MASTKTRYAFTDPSKVGVVSLTEGQMKKVALGSIADLPESKADVRIVLRKIVGERIGLEEIAGAYTDALTATNHLREPDHRVRMIAAEKLSELIGVAPKSEEAVTIKVEQQKPLLLEAITDDDLAIEVQRRIMEQRGGKPPSVVTERPKYGALVEPPPNYKSPGVVVHRASSASRPATPTGEESESED